MGSTSSSLEIFDELVQASMGVPANEEEAEQERTTEDDEPVEKE